MGLAAALGAPSWQALAQGVKQTMPDGEFAVRLPGAMRADLLRRIDATRWSDAVTADWRYGMDKTFLRTLMQHWRTHYDFDAAEARLNA